MYAHHVLCYTLICMHIIHTCNRHVCTIIHTNIIHPYGHAIGMYAHHVLCYTLVCMRISCTGRFIIMCCVCRTGRATSTSPPPTPVFQSEMSIISLSSSQLWPCLSMSPVISSSSSMMVVSPKCLGVCVGGEREREREREREFLKGCMG